MELVIRATVIFFFMWVLTRGLGKRELASMTAFELVLIVSMGDLIQQGVTQDDTSLTGAMLAVGAIALWILLFSWLDFRFPWARRVIDGSPVVLIRDGHVLDDNLRRERMPIDELLEGARNQGIADLAKVRLALIEADGRFSFITDDGQSSPPEESGAQKL